MSFSVCMGAIELVERDLRKVSDHAPEKKIQLHEIPPKNTKEVRCIWLISSCNICFSYLHQLIGFVVYFTTHAFRNSRERRDRKPVC